MKKIYFVEDDPGIQDIAKMIFEKAGYQVTLFTSGAAFLAHDIENADVIIMDKQLPDMDGIELCRQLKQKIETAAIPVIMLSANPEIQKMAAHAGADAAIEKPFSLKTLRETVAMYV